MKIVRTERKETVNEIKFQMVLEFSAWEQITLASDREHLDDRSHLLAEVGKKLVLAAQAIG